MLNRLLRFFRFSPYAPSLKQCVFVLNLLVLESLLEWCFFKTCMDQVVPPGNGLFFISSASGIHMRDLLCNEFVGRKYSLGSVIGVNFLKGILLTILCIALLRPEGTPSIDEGDHPISLLLQDGKEEFVVKGTAVLKIKPRKERGDVHAHSHGRHMAPVVSHSGNEMKLGSISQAGILKHTALDGNTTKESQSVKENESPTSGPSQQSSTSKSVEKQSVRRRAPPQPARTTEGMRHRANKSPGKTKA